MEIEFCACKQLIHAHALVPMLLLSVFQWPVFAIFFYTLIEKYFTRKRIFIKCMNGKKKWEGLASFLIYLPSSLSSLSLLIEQESSHTITLTTEKRENVIVFTSKGLLCSGCTRACLLISFTLPVQCVAWEAECCSWLVFVFEGWRGHGNIYCVPPPPFLSL